MKNISFIKKFINPDFFELPKNAFVSILKSFKAGYSAHKIETILPFLFVVNKTSEFDKFFVTKTFNFPFVFLKDSVVQKLHNNSLQAKEKAELTQNFKLLKEALISVVIFPEKHQTLLGACEKVSKNITDFVFELGFNIKFFSLVNTFFVSPVWTNEVRRCDAVFNQQFNLKAEEYKDINKDLFFEKFNKFMPSSSSVLLQRFNPRIRSRNRAEHTESMFYCCPSCERFFTLFSEFNCLKCRECGTALEFAFNGKIELSSKITNIDDFAKFQIDKIKNYDFGRKPIIKFENLLYVKPNRRDQLEALGEINAEFFDNKVHIFQNEFDKIFNLKDAEDVYLLKNNILHIKTKTDEVFLQGANHENLYFFVDLFNASKKKD